MSWKCLIDHNTFTGFIFLYLSHQVDCRSQHQSLDKDWSVPCCSVQTQLSGCYSHFSWVYLAHIPTLNDTGGLKWDLTVSWRGPHRVCSVWSERTRRDDRRRWSSQEPGGPRPPPAWGGWCSPPAPARPLEERCSSTCPAHCRSSGHFHSPGCRGSKILCSTYHLNVVPHCQL